MARSIRAHAVQADRASARLLDDRLLVYAIVKARDRMEPSGESTQSNLV